ncbi:hypothetical protein [uncultured Olegusella sp.]|uniref:hypothetical protein n=1 Tax=uncultured Olegusella sp. TaxID=1979846 RepID=UPI0026250DAF|nr:hypothetical protein [uncultured Olegusella sp.]
MGTTAFPIRQTWDGVGTTDTALRQIVAALYPNKGIISGLKVIGTNSLAYNVLAGVAVCSKGTSDGNTLAYSEGGSLTVAANDTDNPRIDTLWITSHDATQGDSDNLVTLGVTQGTAEAIPTEPQIPTYATKIVSMLMPAGAVTTASATQNGTADYAIPYGASLGVLHSYQDTTNGNQKPYNWKLQNAATISLPTDRILHLRYSRSVSARKETSEYVAFLVDGEIVASGELTIGQFWAVRMFDAYVTVPAGTHSIAVKDKLRGDAQFNYRVAANENGMNFLGMQFQIIDAGVVR